MPARLLPRSTPAAEGVDPAAVLALIDAAEAGGHGLHSLMVVRHGAVVAEGWWRPYAESVRHTAFSVSKSFLSTAIGMAQAEGLLSIDEPAIDFFPEVASGPRDVTLRHLLMMANGHETDTMAIMRGLPAEDWPRLFFSVPFVHPPGTFFLYDSGGSYLLSVALTRRSGQSPREFLEQRLFRPLGRQTPPWATSPAGFDLGGSGTRLLTEDIAMLSELYRRGGVWDGVRILSQEWADEATAKQVDNAPNVSPDWALGYGYQFWRSQHGYRMDGAFGQFGLVVPELDLVVAITAGAIENGPLPQLVWDHLLPGIHDGALPAEPDAEAALGERLAALTLAAPAFLPQPPARESGIAGRRFTLPFTTQGIAAATLDFDGDTTVFTTLGTDGRTETLRAGRSDWVPGATERWPYPELERTLTASRAGWIDDRTFEIHEQCIETAFRRIWRFVFADGPAARLTVTLDIPFWVPRVETVDAAF